MITVTDVVTAPGGKRYKGKQEAVAELFDGFQALGAGRRLGAPSHRDSSNSRVPAEMRLRFEFDLVTMPTVLRQRLCVGGTQRHFPRFGREGFTYHDIGESLMGRKKSCFALHACASLLGVARRNPHLLHFC